MCVSRVCVSCVCHLYDCACVGVNVCSCVQSVCCSCISARVSVCGLINDYVYAGYVYVCTYNFNQTYVLRNKIKSISTYPNIHTCMCMRVHRCMCACVCVYMYMCACVCRLMCVHVYVCVRVCAYVSVNVV